VKRLLQLCGGQINAESKADEGTTFMVILPLDF